MLSTQDDNSLIDHPNPTALAKESFGSRTLAFSDFAAFISVIFHFEIKNGPGMLLLILVFGFSTKVLLGNAIKESQARTQTNCNILQIAHPRWVIAILDAWSKQYKDLKRRGQNGSFLVVWRVDPMQDTHASGWTPKRRDSDWLTSLGSKE